MPGSESVDLPPVLLQNRADGRWLWFDAPIERLIAHRPEEVPGVVERVERAADEGLVACGFLSYESAGAFDPVLETHEPGDLPLAWFSLHDPETVRRLDSLPELPPQDAESWRLQWTPDVSPDEHARAVAQIREWIAAGETYQLNYTFRLRREFRQRAEDYFAHLAARHGSGHAAWIDTGRHAICSLSPELFFRLEGDRITARPMKGTAPRGRTNDEDLVSAKALRASPKNRAENVMIVDMVRNDLSRIARRGTVEVPALWEIERYPTLFQMTSTCTARTDAALGGILDALFPCASITGAPKVRTMQLIKTIETAPRGIYTGAIGSIGPGRRAELNVAIRTVHIDREAGTAEYGTGGGIVWDSEPASELAECLTKSLVVTAPEPSFHLLETIGWEPGEGLVRLEGHLGRLADSATYFGWSIDLDLARRVLLEAVDAKDSRQRVRLLVSRNGSARAVAEELTPLTEPRRVVLAAEPVDSGDRYLFHKTTHRLAYDRARASAPTADDVLLFNERGEITESTIANIVVEIGGERLTPPITCGLLPGVLRGEMVASGAVREAVIRAEDLPAADQLWLVSSLRGELRAFLEPHAETPPPDSP